MQPPPSIHDFNIYLDSQIQSLAPENWVSPVISASIHLNEGDYESALRVLQLTDHLEGQAMQAQIYVSIERPDLGK